jgi:isoquinoline 1-oxidoreductase alpha subunit
MQLMINDRNYEVPAEPERPLLWVLRDELGLTGTKFGCGVGVCGSCTVLIDGVATRSCLTSVSALEGRRIRTIEGLAVEEPDGSLKLHPVQQAFLEEQVPQCSYCMSGQMLTAVALLEKNPRPDDQDILDEMSRVYCRCGTYNRIQRAVKRAVEIQAGQA